jgi:hypothetical protein
VRARARGTPRAFGPEQPRRAHALASRAAPATCCSRNLRPCRTGLLQGDTIQRVLGPVSHSLQWLVSWRSSAISTLTNSQLKAEAPLLLIDWYESAMVLDD